MGLGPGCILYGKVIDGELGFYYRVAEVLSKSVAEVLQLSEVELQGWSEYLNGKA